MALSSDPSATRFVLLIEDDPATTRLMRLILEGDGCTVEVVGSRDEALATLSGRDPALIIMDFLMGGLGPEEFIESARRGGFKGKMLLCTAMQKQPILKVDDVLLKPFDPGDLGRKVARLLSTTE